MFDAAIDNDPILKPFQKDNVKFLSAKSPRKKILADEMGLGKTLSSIKAADIVYDRYSSLSFEKKETLPRFQIWVVCPSFAVRSWEREIMRWSRHSDRVQKVLKGVEPVDGAAHWVIMSYDIAKVKAQECEIGVPTIFICDEAHYLKNRESQRTRVVLGRIGAACRQLWLLTGTLFPNKRVDGWTLFNACDEHKYRYWDFAETFGYVRTFRMHGREIKQPYGAKEEGKLIDWIKNFTMMHKASDVLKDLPAFQDIPVYVKPNVHGLKASPKLRELLGRAIEKGESPINIEELATALRLLGESKISSAVEYCANLIESDSGPLVIFAHNTDVVQGVCEGLNRHFKGAKRFEVFNGQVSGEKRGKLAEEYEAGKIDALCCNIQAAGVNLTLVRGSHAVFVQEPWSPGDLEQARARIRRIGQTKFCVYHTLLVDGSLDEVVHDSIRNKRKGTSDFDREYKRQAG